MFKKTKSTLAMTLSMAMVASIVTIPGVASAATATQLSGKDRYETALKIVEAGWTKSDSAVIARGDDLADALAAAPLAYAKGKAPILLTQTNSIPAGVLQELKDLGVKNVYIAGGVGAVSKAVADKFAAAGLTVTRVSGNDRFETSLAIAKEAFGTAKADVVIANGISYADALSVSAIAANKGMPILLVNNNKLSAEQTAYIAGKTVYAIGGEGVLNADVVSATKAIRLSGLDRYKTNAAVLAKFKPDYSKVYIAKGSPTNLVDALAGSALAALTNSPIVLVDGNNKVDTDLQAVVKESITASSALVTLGGTVTQTAVDTIEALKSQDVAVKSVTAVAAKTLKVTFNKGVDTTKAVFAVTKAGVALNVAKTTFATDSMSATLELSAKLTKGDYVVNVTGLSTVAMSGTVTVEDEKVSKIEILSDLAVVDNSTSPQSATVGYKVSNQYGEDTTKATALTTNDDTKIHLSNGTATIDLLNAKLGDKIALTLINAENAITTTKILTLSAQSAISEVSISGIYNKDKKTLSEDSVLGTDKFYLLVDAKDQYGNVITDTTKAVAGLIKSQTNPTVVDTATSYTTLTIDGKTQLAIQLMAPTASTTPKAGESQIILIAIANGKSATSKIVVAEATRADVVTLSQPTLTVAGEDIYVPVSVTDKTGKAITDVTILNSAKGVTVKNGAIVGTFVTKDGLLYVKLPSVSSEGVITLVAQSSTYKVSTLTISVKKVAVATVIRGLKSTVSPTMLASKTKDIAAGDLVIEDQYGRVMDSAVALSVASGMKVIVKDSNVTSTSLISNDVTKAITSTIKNTLTSGTTNGTEKFEFVLNNGTNDISGSSATVDFRVTDGTEYVSYAVDAVGTVYDEYMAGHTNAAGYNKTVKVYGVLSDGSKVGLTVGNDFTVTSTNAVVNADVNADAILNVDEVTTTGAVTYAADTDTKVVPINVTINKTGQEFAQDVTYSKVAPKVSAVSFVDTKNVDADAITTTSAAVSFNINNLDAAGTFIVVTDQYGVSSTTTTGAITFMDGTAVAAPTLTVIPVEGSITIAYNGTSSALVTEIGLGDKFTVKVTYAGGMSNTITITGK